MNTWLNGTTRLGVAVQIRGQKDLAVALRIINTTLSMAAIWIAAMIPGRNELRTEDSFGVEWSFTVVMAAHSIR